SAQYEVFRCLHLLQDVHPIEVLAKTAAGVGELPRRVIGTEANGRRSTLYQMIVADTESNELNRVAEQPQPDVEWILEGGVCMKLTQVDETTIDVSFDYWAPCESERHAQHYFVL
ncbi:hypothetical protein JG687_00017006, partial [Phytophthora cactorum]